MEKSHPSPESKGKIHEVAGRLTIGCNGQRVAPSSAVGSVLRLSRGTDHAQHRQARRAARTDNRELNPWTLDETLDFLAAARKDPLYAAFVLAIAMGLRRGESVGLRWSDLDLDNRVLYVRKQTKRRRGVLYDEPEEPPSPCRPAARTLHRTPALAPDAPGGCSGQGGGEVAGVCVRLHHPHRPPGRAAERLPLLHPHRPVRGPPRHPAARRPARHRDPPHSGWSRATRRDGDPRPLSDSITMDVYTHVVQDTQREALSHMDRLLRRRPGRQ